MKGRHDGPHVDHQHGAQQGIAGIPGDQDASQEVTVDEVAHQEGDSGDQRDIVGFEDEGEPHRQQRQQAEPEGFLLGLGNQVEDIHAFLTILQANYRRHKLGWRTRLKAVVSRPGRKKGEIPASGGLFTRGDFRASPDCGWVRAFVP